MFSNISLVTSPTASKLLLTLSVAYFPKKSSTEDLEHQTANANISRTGSVFGYLMSLIWIRKFLAYACGVRLVV